MCAVMKVSCLQAIIGNMSRKRKLRLGLTKLMLKPSSSDKTAATAAHMLISAAAAAALFTAHSYFIYFLFALCHFAAVLIGS